MADANLTRFIQSVSSRNGLQLRSHDDLYAWSISHPADFWQEVAQFGDVRADWGSGPALEQLVSGLATGATLVLYDGSPLHPDAGCLWRMAQEKRITIFGTSAKYMSALEKSSFVPAKEVDLSSLRTVLSTGSLSWRASYVT